MTKRTTTHDDEREFDLSRGNVIIAKGGRAVILTPSQAVKVLEGLIDWESDERRRSKRIEVG